MHTSMQMTEFGSVGSKLKSGVKAVGKGAVKVVKTVGKLHLKALKLLVVMPLQAFSAYVLHPALAFVIKPVVTRINTISTRRAKKLSWDRRKTLVPNAAETTESKKWTRNQLLHHRGIGGKLVAALAYIATVGAKKPKFSDAYELGATGVEESVIAASVPIAIVIVTKTMDRLLTKGAPKDPRGAPSQEDVAKAKAAEAELAKLQQEDAERSGATGIGGQWAKLPLWAKIAIPAGGALTIGGIIYLFAKPSSDDTTVVAGGWGGYPAR